MNNKEIVTPCMSVCKTDPISGFCYGCGRTDDDKKMWKDLETSDEWKTNNLELLRSRLNGWQLEAFDKSYAFKKETGITLINQKLLQQKK